MIFCCPWRVLVVVRYFHLVTLLRWGRFWKANVISLFMNEASLKKNLMVSRRTWISMVSFLSLPQWSLPWRNPWWRRIGPWSRKIKHLERSGLHCLTLRRPNRHWLPKSRRLRKPSRKIWKTAPKRWKLTRISWKMQISIFLY